MFPMIIPQPALSQPHHSPLTLRSGDVHLWLLFAEISHLLSQCLARRPSIFIEFIDCFCIFLKEKVNLYLWQFSIFSQYGLLKKEKRKKVKLQAEGHIEAWYVIKTYVNLFSGPFSIHLLFVLGALRNDNPHTYISQSST